MCVRVHVYVCACAYVCVSVHVCVHTCVCVCVCVYIHRMIAASLCVYLCVVQEGLTSLMLATQKGHAEIVEALLNANCDPNITENVSIE